MTESKILYKFIPSVEQSPMVVNGQFCKSELDKYLSEGWKECTKSELDKIKSQAVKESATKTKRTKQDEKEA